MIEVKQWSEAPAGTYNPFANDERCYVVHYIADEDVLKVLDKIKELFNTDDSLVDYDYFEDFTVEKWVGVTCRDIEV